ncbi:MAG: hypothetical protein IJV83_03895 [Clostridia bacterium]|nr:hypothetical protein [Clostridia bacterium]
MDFFKKLRREVNRDALIKSLAYSFAFAVFFVGLSILFVKRLENALKIGYLIFIGVFATGLIFATLYFLLKKTEKKLARALDEKYALNEKVQTMVAFQNEEGTIVQLQREDAEQRLQYLPRRGNVVKRFWMNALAVSLGIGMLITGIAVPKKESAPIVIQPPQIQEATFKLSDYQRNKINALILSIETESALKSPAKEQTVAEIKKLIADLETVTLEKTMKEKVIDCIVAVDGYVDAVNTYKKICVELDNSANETVRIPAVAMIQLDPVTLVKVMNERLATSLTTKEEIAAFFTETYVRMENLVKPKDVVAPTMLLSASSNEGVSGEEEIEDSSNSDSKEPQENPLLQDSLYVAVKKLAEQLGKISASEENFTEEGLAKEIEKVLLSACGNIDENDNVILSGYLADALEEQKENLRVRIAVIDELTSAFRIDKSELPLLACDVIPSVGGLRGGEDGDGTGGSGGGGTIYAGSDKIFDPIYADGHVEYGKVLENDEYKEKYAPIWEGEGLSDELKAMLQEYSQKLLDGTQKA